MQSEAKEALEGLTPKQRKFVLAYVAEPNATEAARKAGYGKPSCNVTGTQNLAKPRVAAAIKALTEPAENKAIANAQERQEFWTAVMRGEKESEGFDTKDRIKASETLGKAHRDFVESVDVTTGGNPIDNVLMVLPVKAS